MTDLPRLSHELYTRNLEFHARNQAKRLMETIRSAIVRPELSVLVEDYYLFVIEDLDRPCQAAELLAQHRSTLAQVLRFETQALRLSDRKKPYPSELNTFKTISS